MIKRTIVIAMTLLPNAVLARPGFYVGVGGGPVVVSGTDVPVSDLKDSGNGTLTDTGGVVLTTELGTGLAGNLMLGYNIMGYAAIEAHATYQGGGDDDAWAAHWQVGARVYPMWHFRSKLPPPLQNLEPSFLVGIGMSFQGWTPPGTDGLAWQKTPTLRYGVGVEYFIFDFFKLAFDFHHVRAPFDRFIFNLDDNIDFDVDPPAKTSFNHILLSAVFHFDVSK